jgi:hypothetical protein
MMRLWRGCVYALSLAAILAATGCQTVDPPPAKSLLSVQLDDSLKRFDSVLVQVFDRDNPSRLLKTLWRGPLTSPASDISGFDMQDFGTDRFIVTIIGFKAGGQAAMQTRIFYAPPPDHQSVLHDSVPPLKPRNWLEALKPSVGTLSPGFDPDSLHYQIKMPAKTDSLNFIMIGAYPGASIRLGSETVASGTGTGFVKIGNTPETVLIRVTDTSTGTASTQQYTLVIIPTLPPGVSLATLKPSTGSLVNNFTPDETVYSLYMPPGKDTVSFLAAPADPRTMTVTIDGLAVFPGQQSQVFTVAKGSTYTVSIFVRRGSDVGYYQITLDNTQSLPP